METLGAMVKVAPGKTAETVEHWSLHRGVELAALSDEAIDAAIQPLVHATAGGSLN